MLKSGSKDNLKWEVSSVNYKKGTFSLLIRRGDDINNRKQILESWNNLSLDSNQNNFIGKRIGDQYYSLQSSKTNTPYLKLNGDNQVNSKYVRVEVLKQTVNYLDENGNVSVPDYSASLPAAFSGSNAGSFSGGTDGDVVHPKAFYQHVTSGSGNMQGLNLSSGNTGLTAYEDALNLLKNQDEFDINMILIPGIIDDVHTAIVTKAIQVCEDRGDCFLIIDPTGHAKNVTDATARATERDSNYAAMYWPWVKLFDSELGRHVWAPSSVSVAGVYSSNDKVAHPWYAPAGLNRGTIQNVSRAERKLRQADRDTLYESNVNPIASFPGQGVVVWGQKTLQKKASALDRVNVRRLMIKLKKFIASSTRFLVFEQNNIGTRQRFLNIVNPFMEQVQSQSGLNSFRVVMDSTNNTPDIVDRNILYGQIFVQPTRTAEFIILDFTIQPTGATFAA
jgi:phage tail sheath protein FI